MAAVRHKADLFEGVPVLTYVKDQTPEICLEAVRYDANALCVVKEQTSEICLEAVRQKGHTLRFVKERTPQICLAAVKQNGMALEYIPRSKQTLPIAIAALKQNPACRKYLADKFCTPEVYEAAGYDYKPEDLAPLRDGKKRERTELKH